MSDEGATPPRRATTPAATAAKARALISVGRHHDAIALLQEAGAPHGEATAAFLLAQAYGAVQWPGRALEAAEAGLASRPSSEWGHRLRATSLSSIARHDEAVEAATEAVRLMPAAAQTHITRGEVLLAAGRINEASQEAEAATSLGATNPAVHVFAGRVDLARHRNREAQRRFEAALALDPENVPARNNLGVAAMRLRRFGRARENFVGAVRLDPRSIAAKNIDAVDRARRAQIISLVCLPVLLWVVVTQDGMIVPATFGLIVVLRRLVGGRRATRRPTARLAFVLGAGAVVVVGVGVLVPTVAVVRDHGPGGVAGTILMVSLLTAVLGGVVVAVRRLDRRLE